MASEKVVEQLVAAARYMDKRELVWGNAGNISARENGDMWISASGTMLAQIHATEFVHCPVTGAPVHITRRPSKELPMHQAIYESRPDVQCVLHASPFYSTLIACSDLKLEPKLFVESMYYLYDIAFVDYFHPGRRELAEAVRAKAADTNVILLRNHGVIVYDTSIREALSRLETLEIASKMMVTAAERGIGLKPLSSATHDDFIHHSGYKPVLPRGASAR